MAEVVEKSDKLHVVIVSSDGEIFTGEADSLSITAWDGIAEILPTHAPFISALKPGLAQLKNGEQILNWCFFEGFVSVENNSVRVAVESVFTKDQIDEAQIRSDLEEALASPALQKNFKDTDFEYLRVLRDRALLQLLEQNS